MTYDPKIHHRRSIRLRGYDYSQAGVYFVTIVTQGRVALFGEVVNGEMRLNRYGEIVRAAWFDLPRHYKHVELGALVVMPNHVHGIIIFNDIGRGGSARVSQPAPDKATTSSSSSTDESKTRPYRKPHALPEIVRAFKSFSARRINFLRHAKGTPVWQRSYYDHIIRNEHDLELTWLYIESNPARWAEDQENPVPR
jgi:REP element-mobilizing transposase RayT